jgi:hypothetical protein
LSASGKAISLISLLVVDIAEVLALIYSRGVRVRWIEDEEHGRRLAAWASTVRGPQFVAYLSPVNENDPEEGTFMLRTAIPGP